MGRAEESQHRWVIENKTTQWEAYPVPCTEQAAVVVQWEAYPVLSRLSRLPLYSRALTPLLQ